MKWSPSGVEAMVNSGQTWSNKCAGVIDGDMVHARRVQGAVHQIGVFGI
jgi:hypothetical protein